MICDRACPILRGLRGGQRGGREQILNKWILRCVCRLNWRDFATELDLHQNKTARMSRKTCSIVLN